jgi:hypothetical protein
VTLDGPVPPAIIALATVALVAVRRTLSPSRQRVVDVAAAVIIIGLTIVLERAMGRVAVYSHGPARLWSSDINSDENSQQVSDPYTFTHVSHGAIFYAVTRPLGARAVMLRAVVAVAIEAAWETYENTEQVISRYRTETLALGYYGDSILNSICDILACGLGFLLAWRLPARVTVTWIVAVEIVLAITIRDNLTLNILMLLHPLEAVKRWQVGAWPAV